MPNYGSASVKIIELTGNLGHVGDLLNGSKPHHLCGWSAAIMALAWIAYCNESDLIYREADCLAFGPWVDKIYEDCGDAMVCFGSTDNMPCAQSLFLVKHEYIPEFTKLYLQLGTDAHDFHLPEWKFAALEKAWPEYWKRFTFGVDRARPDGWMDQRPMYVQHLTQGELEEMKRRGMI